MAELITIKKYCNNNGELGVYEKLLPNGIKRVYYIKNVPSDAVRGGHRHKNTSQILVSIQGNCIVNSNNGEINQEYKLDSPDKCLLLDPADWHTMSLFSSDCILLVLANTVYDVNDYIDEPYT